MARLENFVTLMKTNRFAASLGTYIQTAVETAERYGRSDLLRRIYEVSEKQAMDFMEYQRVENYVKRDAEKDHIFPIETVRIQEFNRKYDTHINHAVIHTGASADEYARSLNALAVTIANEIYFRNGAYQPESEEGRSILAHELTHVQQYEEKRITKQISKEDLEREAERREENEKYKSDEKVRIRIKEKIVEMKKSEMEKTAEQIAAKVVERVEQARNKMSEEKYLEYLKEIEKQISGGYTAWLS